MKSRIRIAVDASGGDNAPGEIVKGAVTALKEFSSLDLLLVGQDNKIKAELSKYSYPVESVFIVNADEVITNDESPTTAIKTKKNSSIVVGLNLVKEKKADAFISAGSTGALLTGATLIIGRIKGISRPALATVLPNKKGISFLIDCGANVDAKPEYLLQFAKMGSIYAENILKVNNPRVALVNVGAEKEKGNMLTKEAYVLLESAGLNFIGNVEPRDIPEGACDVIVADAFAGNVILKLTEGLSTALFSIIKKEITADFISKIAGILLKPAFKRVKKRFDYSEYGGAPFLGLKSLVVKAHGSSDAKAIKSAIRQCVAFVKNDISTKIEKNINS